MPPTIIHDVSTNVLRKQAVNPSLLTATVTMTTNGAYTDITSASIAATTGTTIAVVTFDRSLRYLKTVVTVSGTTIGYAATVNECYKTF